MMMRRWFLVFQVVVVVVGSPERRLVEAARAADALAVQGDHDGAVAGFEAALESSLLPRGVRAVTLYNYGLSLFELERHRDAGKAFLEASQLVESDRRIDAAVRAGDAFAKALDWSEAAKSYENAASLGDKRAAANAGAALLNCGDKRAVTFLQQPGSATNRAHLAAAYALVNNVTAARLQFQRLAEDPGDALFAGILLEAKANRTDLAEEVLAMAARNFLANRTQSSPQISSVFYRLQRLSSSRLEWRKKAVEAGVWLTELQMPGFVAPQLRGFPSRPWIKEGFEDVWQPVLDLAAFLKTTVFPILQRELEETCPDGTPDDEGIARDPETWRQIIFKRDGKYRDSTVVFPESLALLRSYLDADLALDLPKSSLELSIFRPGTSLVPHCGPSNHRIRLHLCLATDGLANLTVGDVTETHRVGEVLIFDDSFLHSAQNGGLKDRVVLLLDVWHPHLNESARDFVRDHFRSG